jgi:hypothetical protein
LSAIEQSYADQFAVSPAQLPSVKWQQQLHRPIRQAGQAARQTAFRIGHRLDAIAMQNEVLLQTTTNE